MDHDLVGGDKHLISFAPNEEYCQCFGPCCIDPQNNDCLCAACDCRVSKDYDGTNAVLDEALKAFEKPMSAEVAAKANETIRTVTPEPPPARPGYYCQDCGTQVYRNGDRGRFPSRCPECKEKR